jgi:hypothetical protein
VGFDVLRQWVAIYRMHGNVGLQERKQRKTYDPDFKLRPQFPLAGLLRVAGLARSTFYYQRKALAGADKHHDLRAAIRKVFERHKVGTDTVA